MGEPAYMNTLREQAQRENALRQAQVQSAEQARAKEEEKKKAAAAKKSLATTKKDWLEFTTTYNLPFDASLQDEEVADLYQQWKAGNAKSSAPVKNTTAIRHNKAWSKNGLSRYITENANGEVVGKSAYDKDGKLIGQYDPESLVDSTKTMASGGSKVYSPDKTPTIKPISAQQQQFRGDMQKHEKQVASQVAKERGPMPWEKPQNKPAPSRKGTRENPYTTNTEVKGAKVGEWCIHKGKPYQLRQVDIDWANGKRGSGTPTGSAPNGKPPSTPDKPSTSNTPNVTNKQIIQLKRTNDWRTLYKLRKAGINVVDRGDYYETDRAIYMKPRKKDGSVVTSRNSTKARTKHYVENQDGEGNWVDYTEDEMKQRGKDAEDAVIKARSRTPLQTIVPRGIRVDTNSTGINPNVLAGVTAGELGRGRG